MHILLLPSYYPSPERPLTGIFYHEQARALTRAGHRVGVLVTPRLDVTRAYLRRVGVKKARLTSHEDYLSEFPVYRMHWGWFPRPLPPLVAVVIEHAGLRAFDLYCREHGRPDVIHAHNVFYGGVLAAQIRRKYAIPVVLTEHSSSYMENLIIFPGQGHLIDRTLRGVDHRVAVSQALADAMKPYAPDSRVEVIGNIVDTQFFVPPLTSPDPPFTFSMIGTLYPLKRQTLLLEAFARRFKAAPVYLRIGGDGPSRERLETLITDYGLQAQVMLLGALTREQVREELWRCHALVSCSVIESFGLTLIEAMACGKPVIATRSGGPNGTVQPGTGLLVPTDDAGALADAMERLIETYSSYAPDFIRAYCEANFSEAAVVGKLNFIYQSLGRIALLEME